MLSRNVPFLTSLLADKPRAGFFGSNNKLKPFTPDFWSTKEASTQLGSSATGSRGPGDLLSVEDYGDEPRSRSCTRPSRWPWCVVPYRRGSYLWSLVSSRQRGEASSCVTIDLVTNTRESDQEPRDVKSMYRNHGRATHIDENQDHVLHHVVCLQVMHASLLCCLLVCFLPIHHLMTVSFLKWKWKEVISVETFQWKKSAINLRRNFTIGTLQTILHIPVILTLLTIDFDLYCEKYNKLLRTNRQNIDSTLRRISQSISMTI